MIQSKLANTTKRLQKPCLITVAALV